MSLADGLRAGFDMALNLAKFEADEEDRKKNAHILILGLHTPILSKKEISKQ